MKPEDQRIAIAEACGWHCDNCDKPPSVCQGCIWTEDGSRRIPDYLNDLNAMHAAEAVICTDPDSTFNYEATLEEIEGDPIRADAAKRAEAFLKTIGKWVE